MTILPFSRHLLYLDGYIRLATQAHLQMTCADATVPSRVHLPYAFPAPLPAHPADVPSGSSRARVMRNHSRRPLLAKNHRLRSGTRLTRNGSECSRESSRIRHLGVVVPKTDGPDLSRILR
jgi:hypothetical protein